MVNDRPSLQDLELLAQISQMLTLRDQDRVLERVIELMANSVGAQHVSLLIHPDHMTEWQQVFVRNLASPRERELGQAGRLHFARRVLDQGLAGWVFRQRQGAIILDTKEDDRWVEFADGTSQARSALCVPFVFNDEVLAVLTLLHNEPYYFNEYHLRMTSIVANQATVTVRNAQLFTKMRQQQQQLEAVLHAAPDPLLVINDGVMVLLNHAATQLLGSVTGENGTLFLHQPIAQIAGDDLLFARISEIVRGEPQSGQTWSFEVRSEVLRRDYLVTVTGWEHPVDDNAGYVVIMREITQMRDLNRFKDEMLRIASHDLRSPLALIVGYCSLIELDTPEESPVRDYLDAIMRSTERMNGLLEYLLHVEQIKNSPLELHEDADFLDLVEAAIRNTTPTAVNKAQILETDIALDDRPHTAMNTVLIREAMENLIGNAIKYTPEGGRVRVSAFQQGDYLAFSVEDNGIGIPKEHLPLVFESFYRVKHESTDQIEGRGLGLNLVKTVIERHNGEVWVESEFGVGSRFGFWIPLI